MSCRSYSAERKFACMVGGEVGSGEQIRTDPWLSGRSERTVHCISARDVIWLVPGMPIESSASGREAPGMVLTNAPTSAAAVERTPVREIKYRTALTHNLTRLSRGLSPDAPRSRY